MSRLPPTAANPVPPASALTAQRRRAKVAVMEVSLAPEQQAQLEAIAASRGQAPAELDRQMLARSLDYEKWFGEAVDEGVAAADRGEFVDHEEVGMLIDERYPG